MKYVTQADIRAEALRIVVEESSLSDWTPLPPHIQLKAGESVSPNLRAFQIAREMLDKQAVPQTGRMIL